LLRPGNRRGPSPQVRVSDPAPRPGGQICTVRDGSLLLEGGPDSLVTQKPAGLALCKQLGLEDELIYPGRAPVPMGVLHEGRLVRVPQGFLMMAPAQWRPLLRSPLFSLRAKARIAAERFVPRRPATQSDESLRSFVTRRFGRELLERAAEPIIGGLFMADANDLSLRMTMPRFLELEQRYGSVSRGLGRMLQAHAGRKPAHHVVSLARGMERLVDRLVATLPRDAVVSGSGIERVEYDRALERWSVTPSAGPSYVADALILACPSYVSARLLRETDPELSRRLGQLDYASCATVSLAYARSAVAAPLDSFGFFVPRTANLSIVACNFSSTKFDGRAPQGTVLLRGFVGGATNPGVLDLDDDEMARRVHETLARILGIDGLPQHVHVHRAPRAMPQYAVDHEKLQDELIDRLAAHPGLFACGTAVGAVGVPDCIASGERAGNGAADYAEARVRGLEVAI
jgi:oxygen-dependent protoporphyrinogen oxidase